MRWLLALSLLLVGFTPPQDSSPTYEVPSAPVLSIAQKDKEGFIAMGVVLTAPSDTSTQEQPILFEWQAETGAIRYQLQISTDPDFNTIIHDEIIE